MDERVYEVVVCSACSTQVFPDADGNYDLCGNCDSLENETIRIAVARAIVLGQVAPRALRLEQSVYFGCVGQAGHYYWTQRLQKCRDYDVTPWGKHIDGGLFADRRDEPSHQGEAHVFHKDGWTAVAFPDRSVDSRGGSWSVFCIPAVLDGPEALLDARAAFPTIFDRYEFEVTLGLASDRPGG